MTTWIVTSAGWGPRSPLRLASSICPRTPEFWTLGLEPGLVGMMLAEAGFHRLTAIDMSPGMLEEARSKAVYRDLHRMVLGGKLDFPDDYFDAVVSIGVLTLGHAPARSLDEMVRVTRPGGFVIFTLRPDLYESAGFREVREELEAAGRWELVNMGKPVQALPKGEPEVLHQLWVFQATATGGG